MLTNNVPATAPDTPSAVRRSRRGSFASEESLHSNRSSRSDQPSPSNTKFLQEYQFHLLQAQKLQYTSSVLRDSSFIDDTLAAWKTNRDRKSRIFMASRPLISELNKWWFQLVFLCFVALQTYRVAVSTGQKWARVGGFESTRFRFVSLDNRRGDGLTPPHVAEFGLLWNGCPVRKNSSLSWEPDAVVARFEEEVRVNGFYFVTAEREPQRDPVLFFVDGFDAEALGGELHDHRHQARRAEDEHAHEDEDRKSVV